MSKIADINEKIAQKVVPCYGKIEKGVVGGFETVTDKCVEVLFAKEGESLSQTKTVFPAKKRKINKTETFPKNFENKPPL